jgi:hypothetical protein
MNDRWVDGTTAVDGDIVQEGTELVVHGRGCWFAESGMVTGIHLYVGGGNKRVGDEDCQIFVRDDCNLSEEERRRFGLHKNMNQPFKICRSEPTPLELDGALTDALLLLRKDGEG